MDRAQDKKDSSRVLSAVIIGMPGSGKTSVGRQAARMLKRKFIDTDDIVRELAGTDIPEIFEKYGEEHFRRLESRAAQIAASERGAVIATGGGLPLKKENMDLLRASGRVYLIERDTELLAKEGRPLSTDLEGMREKRMPVYLSVCDVRIENGGTVEEAAAKIAQDILNAER